MDLTIAHADVREMARNLANGDAKRQADVFAALLRRLAAAGAELAVVTSMGGHFCIRELEAISPIPILNAIPEVAAEIERRKFKRVGILGTRMVMETRLYGAISSAAVVVPHAEALEEVHKNYAEMASVGRVTDAQRRVFVSAGQALSREQGAEVVLLGGTDLFLAFQSGESTSRRSIGDRSLPLSMARQTVAVLPGARRRRHARSGATQRGRRGA